MVDFFSNVSKEAFSGVSLRILNGSVGNLSKMA